MLAVVVSQQQHWRAIFEMSAGVGVNPYLRELCHMGSSMGAVHSSYRVLGLLPRPHRTLVYFHLLESTSQEGVLGSAGNSQKAGQEDPGEVKDLGRTPP